MLYKAICTYTYATVTCDISGKIQHRYTHCFRFVYISFILPQNHEIPNIFLHNIKKSCYLLVSKQNQNKLSLLMLTTTVLKKFLYSIRMNIWIRLFRTRLLFVLSFTNFNENFIVYYFFLNKTLDYMEFKSVNEKRVLTIILKVMSKNVKQT